MGSLVVWLLASVWAPSAANFPVSRRKHKGRYDLSDSRRLSVGTAIRERGPASDFIFGSCHTWSAWELLLSHHTFGHRA